MFILEIKKRWNLFEKNYFKMKSLNGPSAEFE